MIMIVPSITLYAGLVASQKIIQVKTIMFCSGLEK